MAHYIVQLNEKSYYGKVRNFIDNKSLTETMRTSENDAYRFGTKEEGFKVQEKYGGKVLKVQTVKTEVKPNEEDSD